MYVFFQWGDVVWVWPENTPLGTLYKIKNINSDKNVLNDFDIKLMHNFTCDTNNIYLDRYAKCLSMHKSVCIYYSSRDIM